MEKRAPTWGDVKHSFATSTIAAVLTFLFVIGAFWVIWHLFALFI